MMRPSDDRELRLPRRVGSHGQRDLKKISFCHLSIVYFPHAFAMIKQQSCNKLAVSFRHTLSLQC